MSAVTSFEQASTIIGENADLADFEDGAAAAEIEEAESVLGVSLPTSYKLFLAKFGTGDFNGREVFGIVPGNVRGTSTPSVVWFTADERSSGQLPNELIPIASPGDGSLICIDTSRVEALESPIIEWRYGAPPSRKPLYANFGDFFLDEVRGSLDEA